MSDIDALAALSEGLCPTCGGPLEVAPPSEPPPVNPPPWGETTGRWLVCSPCKDGWTRYWRRWGTEGLLGSHIGPKVDGRRDQEVVAQGPTPDFVYLPDRGLHVEGAPGLARIYDPPEETP